MAKGNKIIKIKIKSTSRFLSKKVMEFGNTRQKRKEKKGMIFFFFFFFKETKKTKETFIGWMII